MKKLNMICDKFYADCSEPLALATESLQQYMNDNMENDVDLRVRFALHLLENLNKKLDQFEMDVHQSSKG